MLAKKLEEENMLEVKPFSALIYNQKKISNMAEVLAPPYDVIDNQSLERYLKKHPYNIVHLDKGRILPLDDSKNNKYTRARNYLDRWIKEEYLIFDKRPSFYIYQEIYTLDNLQKEVTGFIGLMRLEEFSSQKILPHERTHSKPILDRLNLLRSCKTHFSQIFSLYQDNDDKISQIISSFIKNSEPFIDIVFEDGIRHRLWRLEKKILIKEIQENMKEKKIFIADGHHRYQTALIYRDELLKKGENLKSDNPHNFVMMYFTNILNKGLTIFPTHRLIQDLNGMEFSSLREKMERYFHIEEIENFNKLFRRLKEKESYNHIFGLYLKNKSFLISLKDKKLIRKFAPKEQPAKLSNLAVSILENTFIQRILEFKKEDIEEKIGYTRCVEEAIKLIDEGRYKIALFVPPTKIEEVKEIARLGVLMPSKSTYFYPKLLTGLVMYKLN